MLHDRVQLSTIGLLTLKSAF